MAMDEPAGPPQRLPYGATYSSSESDSGGPGKEKSHAPLSAAGADVL